jgi:hypothetical protein
VKERVVGSSPSATTTVTRGAGPGGRRKREESDRQATRATPREHDEIRQTRGRAGAGALSLDTGEDQPSHSPTPVTSHP